MGMSDKELILQSYDKGEITKARNSMGCSENWYFFTYSISHTFSKEEVENMSDETIALLVRLAEKLSEVFY